MKIKTIKAHTPEEFDDLVNDFGSENKVKFTQTHYEWVSEGKEVFVAVIFYEAKEQLKPLKVVASGSKGELKLEVD